MDTDTSLFTLGDGKTTSSTITLTRNSVPTDYLNCKVNVASSEMENNAENARDYSLFNPFIRFARWKDSKVKDCMEFFNGVIFIKERDEDISTHREFQDTNWHFYSLCNVGDSKKTDDSRVNDKNDPKEYVVEITDYNVPLAEFPTGYGENGKEVCPESEWKAGNTAYDHLYTEYEYEDGEFKSFGNKSYEFRYEMKKITEEQRQVNIDTWRDMYKFLATSTNEEFYTRLKEWFVVDSALYYYLFTENRIMVDNRAKNLFIHYGKVYISDTEATTLGEDAGGYIIDNEQASIRNGYRYDFTFGYDFDTSWGIGNTGKLNIPYGSEDVDFYVDGDPTSGYIYRAAESTFFCRIRDLFTSELQAMYVDRENVNAWSASRTIKQWDNSQSQFPEELYRLHYRRLYTRTYQGVSIDNSFPGEANPRFLEEMMNGKKKYQRRMFMRNNELYFATKYFGKVATQDQIMMRFNNPVGAVIRPDFTLYITPYSDMYIGTSFGNVTPTNFRAKAGIEYSVPCSIESGTADITLIYGASFIQAIGDLSKCYVGDNDFSKASRLQSLVIGSNVSGYENSFMTKISLGNNKLLEYLDIRNVTGLNSVVDLSKCGNLIELHAENSGATGIIFANGGKVEKAYIPAITSLTVKNLNYLKEFIIENYNKLQTLVVENTPFLNTYEMVNISPILRVLRLVGIDWSLENTDILNRILGLRGINNTGAEIETSVLSGNVYVSNAIKQKEYEDYKAAWSDLIIDCVEITPQYSATFLNTDGQILDVQYIDEGLMPVDPVLTNRIDTPIQIPTVEKEFTFTGWNKPFEQMFENMVFTAVYSSSIREYTVKYVSEFDPNPLQVTKALYGSIVEYEGYIPTYNGMEGQTGGYRYYLFDHWDKSGYVNGDKTINAVFDVCRYTGSSYFAGREFNDLRPVEKYALLQLNRSGDLDISQYVDVLDELTFKMGEDYDFDEITSKLLVDDKVYLDTNESTVFTGNNYINTGISLMDQDRSFVLAVDFELASNNSNGATLMQCFDHSKTEGFRLSCNGSNPTTPTMYWTENNTIASKVGNREMIVLRHTQGEPFIHVYKSNLSGDSMEYVSLEHSSRTYIDPFNSALIFGCALNAIGQTTAFASGTIHWAKLWYGDLGDNVCRNIAKYTKEEIHTQMCGHNRKLLADGTGYGTLSFIATHTLRKKSRMNSIPTGGTEGGWGDSIARGWLNTRFYDGLPLWVKQLIKPVKVDYFVGGSNPSSTTSCNCNVFLPSVTSLSNEQTYSSSPYTNEEKAILGDKCISYMTSPGARIRRDYKGDAVDYWTRSVYQSNTTYFAKITAEGKVYAFSTSSTELGLVVEFCM